MSTVFEAHPTTQALPSFVQIIALAEQRVREFLRSRGIDRSMAIVVRAVDARTRVPLTMAPTDSFGPHPGRVIDFCVDGVAGSTSAHFDTVDELVRSLWEEESLEGRAITRLQVARALDVGHFWCFARSGGQPAEIDLVYAYLAAAVAELTEGFVMSIDSAWDDARLPATPQELYEAYLDPDQERGRRVEWVRSTVADLARNGLARGRRRPGGRRRA